MRPSSIVWALALFVIADCRGARHASAPATARPTVRPEPAHPPTAAATLEGAAGAVAHPNEAALDDTLGARVTPRALPLPAVALGHSARFTFHGQRRGWVLQLATEALATPAYSHGKVFVGAGFHSTKVYALDAHTGALAWMADTPDGGPTAALVDDDRVLFNTESCTLFAFDARTGRQRWSHTLGDPLMSQPASAQGRVFSAYPTTSPGSAFSFSAMSLRNGHFLWTRAIPADVLTAPVIDGEFVYAATMDGSVFKFRARDGRVLWHRAIEATSAPAIDGDRVFLARRAAHGRERQVVLSTADGSVVSSTDAVRAPYARTRADVGGTESGWRYEGARPTYADGRLYHAMGDEVVARDAADGRVVWRRRYPGSIARRGMTSPSVVGSQLVVGTRSGDLFGMDIDTGMTTWAYHVGEPIVFQPAVANGWVYATTERGKVIGLEIGDAELDGWHMWGGNAVHNGQSAHETIPDEDRPAQGTLRAVGRDGQPFPLLHTSVRAEVTGAIARVTVEQSFSNPHASALDAEYLFPLPADAAVDAMDLYVGARVIHGAIQRREEARRTYQRARAQGHTAALLEQERPNLFRQSVANLRPGESVRVVLRFAEIVPWRDGRYEFVMPLATGSRYTPGAGGATPERPAGDIDLSATLDLGAALDGVESPTHPVSVSADGAHITLTEGRALPDRDFVLRYRPRVAVVAPTLLARRDGGDGFFTLTLHPDARASEADLTPREMVFVVDTSSSMRGAPLEHAKALLRRAIERMRPTDTFRVVRFSDAATELSSTPLAPTPANLARARAWVDRLQAAGATEMLPGLRAALAGTAADARMRVVVLVTDGYIGNEREVLGETLRSLGAARVFTFGVGTAVNRYLLEQLAEVGRGVSEVVTAREAPDAAAERFYTHIDRPYLTDVAVDWGGLDVSEVYPRAIPDVFADHPVLLQGRYARGGEATVRVTGRIHGRAWSQSVHVRLPEHAQDHEALPSVWARARIHDLSRAMLLGELPALREEVTQLGLRFGLMTDYTSFVAVDDGDAVMAARGRVPGAAASGNVTGSSFGFGGLGSVATGWGEGGGSGVASRGIFAVLGGDGAPVQESLTGRVVMGPTVRASPPEVAGGMDAALIRAVVMRNIGQVRAAYERALRSNPTRAGRVVIRFVIGAEGRVISAAVSENSTGDPEVGFAIAEIARGWVFPETDGVVAVSYPFVFEPAPPESESPPAS